eukprot:361871-Chlamydomonas_euryale.AAC.7
MAGARKGEKGDLKAACSCVVEYGCTAGAGQGRRDLKAACSCVVECGCTAGAGDGSSRWRARVWWMHSGCEEMGERGQRRA